jgi:hypothetical protein
VATYTVVMRADVMVEFEVEADSMEAAEAEAYEAVADADYEVDFTIDQIEEAN